MKMMMYNSDLIAQKELLHSDNKQKEHKVKKLQKKKLKNQFNK